MNVFDWLTEWFKSHCDGGWEHYDGITIETLDNPGWSVRIYIEYTSVENKDFEKVWIDNGDDDWIRCWVKDKEFNGRGDPNKLREILEIFRNWVER